LVVEKSQFVGLLTEQDVVRFSAEEASFTPRSLADISLADISLADVMTRPVVTLQQAELTDIPTALHLFQQHAIRHLPVLDEQGQVMGLLTEETLHQAWNAALTEKVAQLEAQQVELQHHYTLELEYQVQQQTADLRKQAEREHLLSTIATRIRVTWGLQNTLDAIVTEVQQFLQCDRVLVYQFNSEGSGIVTAEAVLPGWDSTLGNTITDSCFQTQASQRYSAARKQATSNIYEAGYSDCHVKLLERYQVKANLVVPIWVDQQLWGLLIGHQCEHDRMWETADLDLLDQIAIQVTIAIQQSQAYEQAQREIVERRQAEAALQRSEATNQAILKAMPDLLIWMNRWGEYQDIISSGTVKFLLPPDESQHPFIQDILPPELATQRLHYTTLALATGQLQVYEQQIEIEDEKYEEEVRITPLNEDEVLVII
ncbi:MAG TPA: GAF domain-containing protein, partial [Allocoleopsis sp.]